MNRYFLINASLPEEMIERLSAFGECVKLPAFHMLPEPICRHPDMLAAKIGDTLILHRQYTEGRQLCDSLGIRYILSEDPVGPSYPQDIRLNCFAVSGFFFANQKYVSCTARQTAEQEGLIAVHVAQGYTKCAAAVIGGRIATQDPSIAEAANKHRIPILKLPPGGIGIERYESGFLGGACAAVNESTLAFFGNLDLYDGAAALRSFFGAIDIRLVSLGTDPLFDYGGLIVV